MEGRKVFLHSLLTVKGAVNDLIEMQKGVVLLSDTKNGRVHFTVPSGASRHELRFTIVDIGHNRSCVTISTSNETGGGDALIDRTFILLDALLRAENEIEVITDL